MSKGMPVIKNEIYTPFGGKTVTLNNHIKVDYDKDKFAVGTYYPNHYNIHDELIHSFEYDTHLNKWNFPKNEKMNIKYILCECIIPKGADYYICSMENVYASNEIIIKNKKLLII